MNKEQAIEEARKIGRKWVAMDADGDWYGYTGKPHCCYDIWRGDGGAYLGGADVGWADSLTEVDE